MLALLVLYEDMGNVNFFLRVFLSLRPGGLTIGILNDGMAEGCGARIRSEDAVG